jgi:hypothetical protein
LPGVTVEATSPALIEKVRTAVTDGTGQYRIENLRPGTYSVTFALSGSARSGVRHRAHRVVHRDGGRRHARGRTAGDCHRHRCLPHRRRAECPARDDD